LLLNLAMFGVIIRHVRKPGTQEAASR